jgi:quercetin dioxygenase-like cupin family protein
MNMPDKQAEPFLLTINPGDPVGEFRHDGQEFIYMLAGRMRFTVGDEVLALGPGDALYFDPTRVHKTEIVGGKPARFLCVFIQGTRRQID